ncbi:fluoride efflux transporter CrcB [Streptomyces avicenniae]|uniref:fluoride efflux transporter CrcB n=1 Tax=Streptomyces avicenniae TaxID=500153 RepID=UPI00069C44C5|nr:fluoride efflux transporter CrcB [Streptomyces avicenniae]
MTDEHGERPEGGIPPVEPPVEPPIDPDAAPTPGESEAHVLAAIALGGALGACARYGAGLLWPVAQDAFPWTTFAVNVTGCAAMGVLMVLVTERFTAHRLVRPFLGTGVLGGYTTFSTYATDARHLLTGGHVPTAILYLTATVACAVAAVTLAARLTRRLTGAPTGRGRA